MKLLSKIKPYIPESIADKARTLKNLYVEGTKIPNPLTQKPNEGLAKVYSGINNIYNNVNSNMQDGIIAAGKTILPFGSLAYVTGDSGLDSLTSAIATAGGSVGGTLAGHSLANTLKAGPARGRAGSLLRALLAVTGATTGAGAGLLGAQLVKGASNKVPNVPRNFNKRAFFGELIAENAYNNAREAGQSISSALAAAGSASLYSKAGALTGGGFGSLLGASLWKKKMPTKSILPGILLGLLPGSVLGGMGGINLAGRIARASGNNIPAHIKDLGYRPIQSVRTADRSPQIVI